MSETAAQPLIRRGTCHLIGDDVSLDDGIIPKRFAAERVLDPTQLIPHLFESVAPELAGRIKPGDIVLAGRNFACGKPRLQGFIAMAALDLAVICSSMPYKMLRRAVARAIPVIVAGATPLDFAVTGEELEIDFSSGAVCNLTQDRRVTVPAMPTILRDIVAGGGMQALLKNWLTTHPEQALQQE